MRVNIYETVEVSDERRKQIAALLGQKTATRDDLKTFIWDRGAGWEVSLDDERSETAPADATALSEAMNSPGNSLGIAKQTTQGVPHTDADFQEYAAPITDEDLIGGGDEADEEDLI